MADMNVKGGYFSPEGYTKINTGGTHEENPNGGVQYGMDRNGVPNVLEENEVVYDDYVYSNRILAEREFLEENNLPLKYEGWPYQKIAEDLLEEYTENPLDPILKNGAKENLARLANSQEQQKQAQQMKELEEALSQLSPEELAALEEQLAMQAQQQGQPMQQPMEQPVQEQVPPEMMQQAVPQEQVPMQPSPDQMQLPVMAACGGHVKRVMAGGGPEGGDLPEAPTLIFNPETGSAYPQEPVYVDNIDPAVAVAYPGKSQAWVDAETSQFKRDVSHAGDEFLKGWAGMNNYMMDSGVGQALKLVPQLATPMYGSQVISNAILQDPEAVAKAAFMAGLSKAASKGLEEGFDELATEAGERPIVNNEAASGASGQPEIPVKISPWDIGSMALRGWQPEHWLGKAGKWTLGRLIDGAAITGVGATLYNAGNYVANRVKPRVTHNKNVTNAFSDIEAHEKATGGPINRYDGIINATGYVDTVDGNNGGNLVVKNPNLYPWLYGNIPFPGSVPQAEEPVAEEVKAAKPAAAKPAAAAPPVPKEPIPFEEWWGDKPTVRIAPGVFSNKATYKSKLTPDPKRAERKRDEYYANALGSMYPKPLDIAPAIDAALLMHNAGVPRTKYRTPTLTPHLPIGDMTLVDPVFRAIDNDTFLNPYRSQWNNTARQILNSGSPVSATAALIAADNTFLQNMGQYALQGRKYNEEGTNNAIAGRNNNASTLGKFYYDIDAAQKGILNQFEPYYANLDLQTQRLNDMAESEQAQAISQQLDLLKQYYAARAKEERNKGIINSNPANEGYGYTIDDLIRYLSTAKS